MRTGLHLRLLGSEVVAYRELFLANQSVSLEVSGVREIKIWLLRLRTAKAKNGSAIYTSKYSLTEYKIILLQEGPHHY